MRPHRRISVTLRWLCVPLALILSAQMAWAVFARQTGNTLQLNNENYSALANQTITITLGDEKKTVTTDEKGNICIKREKDATDEEKKRANCAIFPGHGTGTIVGENFNMSFNLTEGGQLSISISQRLSNAEMGGIAVGTAGAIYLATKNDNNASSTSGGGSSTGGGGTGTGGGGGQPPATGLTLNDCPGDFSVQFSGFTNAGGCPNLFSSGNCGLIPIGGDQKIFDCGAFHVTGTFNPTTGIFIATGMNPYSIVPAAPYNFNATFSIQGNACTFGGNLKVGPPLTSNSEFCQWNSVTGSGTRNKGP